MNGQRTPLHAWLGRKMGLAPGREPDAESLAQYQLRALGRIVEYARKNSPFYRDRLARVPPGFPRRLEDLAGLPFTTEEDLRRDPLALLCLSQDRVARVVTLHTSGTTHKPKRLFFSDQDLELTKDFFHHGMSTLVEPGQCVLILLPGAAPDSVGDLLAQGLDRMGVRGVIHGPISDPGPALALAEERKAHCVVGIPVQVLALAEHPGAKRLRGRIKSVLLTTDYVPRSLAARIEAAWGCEVFNHYGMTETGLGGGVDCQAHQGLHLRGADLYYEVVDPDSGTPLPLGQEGELVVTTLTREAMPLIRYRTGDLGRILEGPCACGGFTPRMALVQGRLANRLDLGGRFLPMWKLDEALFQIPGLLDYRAGLSSGLGEPRLKLILKASTEKEPGLARKAEQALGGLPELAPLLAESRISLETARDHGPEWAGNGTAKRTFVRPQTSSP